MAPQRLLHVPLLLAVLLSGCGSDDEPETHDHACVASCTEGTNVKLTMTYSYPASTAEEAMQRCNFDKLDLDASACGATPLVCLCQASGE